MAAWTLGSVAMAAPADYRVTVVYRGATVEMADGTEVTDLVNASAKRLWTLDWANVTASQRSQIETAYGEAVAGAVTFRDENDSAHTVQVSGLEPMRWTVMYSPSGYRFSSQMTLREV